MTRRIYVLAPALIGVALGTLAAPPWNALRIGGVSIDGRQVGPRVALATTTCDLGVVPAGASPAARFPISNEGGHRLIVRRERSACCAQEEHGDSLVVPAGQSAELLIIVNTAGQRDRLIRTVAYTTNDHALPRFELNIAASLSETSNTEADSASLN